MKTEIYIKGKTKNPAKQKKAEAKWCIRCVLGNGQEVTKAGTVVLNNVTTKRAVLSALLEALEKFNKAAVIRIYVSDDFVRACLINNWLGRWKSNDWHKIRLNGEVRHLDLWQQISLQLSRHAVTFARGEELENKQMQEMKWRE